MIEVKLGYDIDGVLAAFSEHFLEYFDFEDKSEATSWDDPRFRENFHKTYNNKDFWLSIPPLVSPLELIPAPHCYITARPIPNEWSMEWLWKNGFPYAPLYTVGEDKPKVEVFLESGATHFVDDALHNFDQLNEAGITCFLKTRSHNLERQTTMRVNDISEITQKIIDQASGNLVFERRSAMV